MSRSQWSTTLTFHIHVGTGQLLQKIQINSRFNSPFVGSNSPGVLRLWRLRTVADTSSRQQISSGYRSNILSSNRSGISKANLYSGEPEMAADIIGLFFSRGSLVAFRSGHQVHELQLEAILNHIPVFVYNSVASLRVLKNDVLLKVSLALRLAMHRSVSRKFLSKMTSCSCRLPLSDTSAV
ncbi:hypothetical protein SCHPADRAFT_733803 [Schizopora paradoxa]|uniref:Uncharacterized protein n=1 Tax=Schizopora paradoxa TaxID=27342 RepID=A0A0H2R0D3_9AGAM|nr:hypothetical protein SCHPADRAFT_733803 [Schizopora paradoxa]